MEAFMPGMRVLGVAFLTLSLAGCGSGSSKFDPASLVAFNRPSAPPVPPPPKAKEDEPEVYCPFVQVLDGASALRVGGSGESVRYQYSLGDLARECKVVNGKIQITVGVEGKVLLGPAGSPGTFSAPIRIAVRKDADNTAAASKLFRVSATVPAGDTVGTFSLVSDVMEVPFTRTDADQDYTIVVGFDSKGTDSGAPAKPRRRRHAAAAAQ
ncbi:hypothetical protein DYH55_13600 [Methylovirgula sp. 4M-Z18]|nr:hypothetical protein DYH55_13600 [Methylovirgula sp. 4M-Z18]